MTPGDAAAVAVLVHSLLAYDDEPLPDPGEVAAAVEHLTTAAREHERNMLPVDVALDRLDRVLYADDYTVHLSGEWHPRFRPIDDVELPSVTDEQLYDSESLSPGSVEIVQPNTLTFTPGPDFGDIFIEREK